MYSLSPGTVCLGICHWRVPLTIASGLLLCTPSPRTLKVEKNDRSDRLSPEKIQISRTWLLDAFIFKVVDIPGTLGDHIIQTTSATRGTWFSPDEKWLPKIGDSMGILYHPVTTHFPTLWLPFWGFNGTCTTRWPHPFSGKSAIQTSRNVVHGVGDCRCRWCRGSYRSPTTDREEVINLTADHVTWGTLCFFQR